MDTLYFSKLMDEENLLMVGVITTTHGVRGEVKVYPTTDDADRFKKLKKVILFNGKDYSEAAVEGVKRFKQFVILKLAGTETMNDALLLKDAKLFVTRAQAVKCEKDEYFIADLIGLNVVDEKNTGLGVISEVYQTGANDVYEIKRQDESTFLIPAIKECVLKVDIKNKLMTIHLMDGLV